MKWLLRSALAIVVAAVVLPSVPASAAPAEKISVAYSVKLGNSVVIPSGSKAHVGDISVTQGVVSAYSGGKVGALTLTETVVDPKAVGGNEARISRAAFVTSGATLFGETLSIAKNGERPGASWYMTVVGGLGAYRSAIGTMTLMYVQGQPWRLSIDVTVVSTPLRQAVQVAAMQSVDSASNLAGGLGSATATTAVIKGGGQFLSSAVTVVKGSTTITRSVDMSIALASGSLLLRGLTVQPRGAELKAASYAIVGGTGDYVAVRGEARIVRESATRSKVSLSFTRLRDGKPETPLLVTTRTRSVTAAPAGAEFLGEIGTLKGKTDKGQNLTGTYDLLVNDSVPVAEVSVEVRAARFELSGGSLTVGAVGPGGTTSQYVILGGTGEYAGARGTIASTPSGQGVARLAVTLWRGGVGPAS